MDLKSILKSMATVGQDTSQTAIPLNPGLSLHSILAVADTCKEFERRRAQPHLAICASTGTFEALIPGEVL